MEKKKYFILCMCGMVLVFIMSLVLFFTQFHKPIANPIEEEVMWDSEGDNGNIVYKHILFSYLTSFADDPEITGFEAETNSVHSFNFAVEDGWVDEKYNVYPDSRHIAKLIIEYVDEQPLHEPVEITKLTVHFAGGYAMEVPIEKCILTPYQKEGD